MENKILISGHNVFINSDDPNAPMNSSYGAIIQSNVKVETDDEIIGRGLFNDKITVYKVEHISSVRPSRVEGYSTYTAILSWKYVKSDTLSVSDIRKVDSKLARAITTAIKSSRV